MQIRGHRRVLERLGGIWACGKQRLEVFPTLYRRIRELREGRNVTQAEIGRIIDVPQRTYSYYETGQRMVPPDVLVRLARFYGVSTDYLLELTDNPKPYG